MTWTRLDDLWTDSPELAELAYDVRWHYLAMIQFCSRTKRFDGLLKLSDARRSSDVDDPADAMQKLTAAGLITIQAGGVRLTRITDHIPPPSVREASEKTKTRMQRSRAHKAGDHSMCLPDNCDQCAEHPTVTSHVTRNTRTGQDGTGRGQALVEEGFSDSEFGAVNTSTGELLDGPSSKEEGHPPCRDSDGWPSSDWNCRSCGADLSSAGNRRFTPGFKCYVCEQLAGGSERMSA